jgi:hypothetical protein
MLKHNSICYFLGILKKTSALWTLCYMLWCVQSNNHVTPSRQSLNSCVWLNLASSSHGLPIHNSLRLLKNPLSQLWQTTFFLIMSYKNHNYSLEHVWILLDTSCNYSNRWKGIWPLVLKECSFIVLENRQKEQEQVDFETAISLAGKYSIYIILCKRVLWYYSRIFFYFSSHDRE